MVMRIFHEFPIFSFSCPFANFTHAAGVKTHCEGLLHYFIFKEALALLPFEILALRNSNGSIHHTTTTNTTHYCTGLVSALVSRSLISPSSLDLTSLSVFLTPPVCAEGGSIIITHPNTHTCYITCEIHSRKLSLFIMIIRWDDDDDDDEASECEETLTRISNL